MVVIAVILFVGWLLEDKTPGSSSGSATPDLNAAVRFTGTQFVVDNRDAYDWTNCKLEINGPGFTSGYVLQVDRIAAHESYTAGAMLFAKDDGERFNPFTHKPNVFSAYCDTPAGKASYYGGWK